MARPGLCAVIVLVAILTKVVGCGVTALACRESVPTSLRIGAGMVGRGEIALVVASIGLKAGLVNQSIFSIAIVMTVATTIAAPLLLKAAYRFTSSASAELAEPVAFVPEMAAPGGQ